MPRKKEALTLSVPPGTKEQLEEIARRLGIFWGKSPSPSGLITALAQQQLEVGRPFTLSKVQVDSLQSAIEDLTKAGRIRDAEIIAALMLERGNLSPQERQTLMQQVSQPIEAWRPRADQLIREEQPFRLLYCDTQKRELEYTVRYAKVSFEEKRFYLNIWCEETQDLQNPEYPELIHNRCLRFDRIQAMIPTSGEWRDQGLDLLEVYLHLYGGLVKAYEPRKEIDIEGQDQIFEEGGKEIRQIVRRVSNPFWLIREVFRYGDDCEIIAPASVRNRFQQKLKALCDRYGLNTSDENP